MSRIGKKPITLPKGVTVKVVDGALDVQGPKGKMRQATPPGINFAVAEGLPSATAKLMPGGVACRILPFGPCTSSAPSTTLTVTPLGSVIGFFPIRDICVSYQILQSTSPPTPALTAALPVITPRDVVRMLVPRPASTSGTSSLPK